MEVSSSRQWCLDKGEEEWLRLIDFIEPGNPPEEPINPLFKPILKKAQTVLAKLTLEELGEAFDELSAYEPPPRWPKSREEYVRYQVRAIYEALREQGIGYAVERWDSQCPGQVIRSHGEILDSEGIGGPCIDLVVLMAACLEAVGIQPLIVVLQERESGRRPARRHAVLGYRLEERVPGPKTLASEIPHLLIEGERIFGLLNEQELYRVKNTGEVEFINCTGTTRGENVCFEEARSQGKDYVEQWKLIFALDVRVARHTALTREMQGYLKRLQDDVLTLPSALGFPSDLNFSRMRVRVKVRKGVRRFSETEARAREIARRQGYTEEESVRTAYQYPWPSPEEEMKREAERPLDWDREVRKRVKRAVVLGDPGFGKTWLLKHEALNLAEEALNKLKEYPLATDEVQLPIFLPLAQLAEEMDRSRKPLPLDQVIFPALESRYSIGKRLREWIKGNLVSERLVFLLDALDELRSGQQARLCERLNDFARKYHGPQILLTSRLVGYPGAPFPLPMDGEFELLPFDRRQQREFVRAWFSGRPERGEAFLRKLRESLQIQALAGIPLLLALMCRLFDESDELPKSRAELYEACIWGILTQKWKTPRTQDASYPHAKLRLAEEIAYRLFIAEKELFQRDALVSLVHQIFQDQPELKEDLENKCPGKLIDEFQTDGLFIKAGTGVNPPFLFLHLTFQEYLAACALARRTKLVQMDGEKAPEWLKLVKPHFFDPRWEEVIRLLASRLEDATPLVQAVWEEREDLFLGRLFLAVKCLADARHIEKSLWDEITKEFLALIAKAVERRIDTPTTLNLSSDLLDLSEIRESLALLAGRLAAAYAKVFQKLVSMLEEEESGIMGKNLLIRALVATGSEKAIPHLLRLLNDPDPDVRRAAAGALGVIGSEKAVSRLIDLLKDPERDVRGTAVLALVAIESADAVPHLIELLRDSELEWPVPMAVGRLGSRKALPLLFPLLKDPNPHARKAAARALGRIGSAEAIPHLIELLKDPDPWVRGAAAEALGEIGEQALPYLVKLFKDPDSCARRSVAWALGWIGSAEAMSYLSELLGDPHPDVRRAAAGALGLVRNEKAIPLLIPLLGDPHPAVRTVAVEVLGKFANKGTVPYLIPRLKDPEPNVRRAAAEALGEIRSDEAIPHLIELLGDYHAEVRRSAARALGSIGSAETIPHLVELLKDPDAWLRGDAAEALGCTGSAQVVPHLTKLLRDPDLHVRGCAARALKRIGSAEVIPHFVQLLKDPFLWWVAQGALEEVDKLAISQLIKLFKDPHPGVRDYALRALWKISRKQGIRIFPDGTFKKIRTD